MKVLLALMLSLIALTALVACGDDDDDETTATPSETATGAPTASPEPTICRVNPDPASAQELFVSTPLPGAGVASPLTITGTTQIFEGRLWLRAFNEAGETVFDQGASTNFGNLATDFNEVVEFTASEATEVCLEVFWNDPSEGGEQNIVQIPITLVAEAAETTPAPSLHTNVCPSNSDPATAEEVLITAPAANATVTSPLTVQGSAAAFEAVIELRIVDAGGNELTALSGMTNEGQTLAPYEETLEFTVAAQTDGCLEVFMLSAENGSVINVAQVPLVLSP